MIFFQVVIRNHRVFLLGVFLIDDFEPVPNGDMKDAGEGHQSEGKKSSIRCLEVKWNGLFGNHALCTSSQTIWKTSFLYKNVSPFSGSSIDNDLNLLRRSLNDSKKGDR